MYKVFINEKVICFTKALENFNDFHNALVMRFFHEELSEFIVDLLLNGKRIEKVFIVTENPDKSFAQFKEQHKLIEAAGGLVRNKENQCLVIERMGKWDLPKGKMEQGESAEQAAIREVEEECGVNELKISKELPPTYHMYEHKEKMVLKTTHWFLMESSFDRQLIPQTEEQITQVKWMNSTEISATVLNNTYASLLPVFELTTTW